jgi:hypothetical protein
MVRDPCYLVLLSAANGREERLPKGISFIVGLGVGARNHDTFAEE